MRRNAIIGTILVLGATSATAQLTPIPKANPSARGVPGPNVLSVELAEVIRAQGSMMLENPASPAKYYGYNDDKPNLGPLPPPAAFNVEATKTEPDKNTYLVLPGQRGADPQYDYGTHFLFQGHEGGADGKGYITRINLDADVAHRVTLMGTRDVLDNPLPVFDGSTWYPWAQKLLFTAERGASGGVWQATAGFPSEVEDVSCVLGRGGYEGIQTDRDGNLWIVEDVGGATENSARQPNGFLYRFVPYDKTDFKAGGQLQVLAVKSKRHEGDIVFHAGQIAADINADDVSDLHTYGLIFETHWITIHDAKMCPPAAPDANALAKQMGGTPFKRPENGIFRPGTSFGEFYFTETGDTNVNSKAPGGFGGLFKVTQQGPSAQTGTLTLFYLSDIHHTAFDNLAFWTEDLLVAVEDRGDTLHTQHNALDSAWMFDVRLDFSNPANQPIRILAQGRDPSATVDSGLQGTKLPDDKSFQNDGDNEITGIHVSDGDASPNGLLGATFHHPFNGSWRVFYTQQHGDNTTFEIMRNPHVVRPAGP